MTRRIVFPVLVLAALAAGAVATLAAHPGHEHKVLGTVTMAAADHVMIKDRNSKDVTVYINGETKVLKDKKPARVGDIKAGMRVVVTAVTVKEQDAEKLVAKSIELASTATAS
jgi:flagellar basal body L-ring protein FlgH